jgi:hypothetical protein
MGIPGRFRDGVALVEATAFGAVGVVAAVLGPWPWLAPAVGPVIFIVVLLVSARPRQVSSRSPQDITGIVGDWARQMDDDAVRADAERVVDLADAVEALIFRCERMIANIEDAAEQRTVRVSLHEITNYLSRRVAPDGVDPPRQAKDWDRLEDRLQTAQRELDELLNRP